MDRSIRLAFATLLALVPALNGSSKENFNGIVFFDEKGHEHTSIHSERHMTLHAEFDTRMKVGRHKGQRIPGASTLTVGRIPGGE